MKLRVSYTLLELWRQGKVDEAVASYLSLETKTSLSIEKGKEEHKRLEKEIKSGERKLFDRFELKKPESELKIVIPYNDFADLVGVLDIYDNPILYEIKTGKTSSSEYLSSYQLSIYSLLLKKTGRDLEKIIVINKNDNEINYSIKYYYPLMLEEAKDFIDSYVFEIYKFFKEKNII